MTTTRSYGVSNEQYGRTASDGRTAEATRAEYLSRWQGVLLIRVSDGLC